MFSHEWAADRLWRGIVEPADAAWNVGAATLAHMTLESGQEVPRELADGLAVVRDLRASATGVIAAGTRADLYDLLLGTCADCHSRIVEHEGGLSGSPD
jgi:hypothetical protein